MGVKMRLLVVGILWIGTVVNGQFANNPHCPSNHRCSVYCDFHGTCSTNGQCVCDEGWTGVNCTIKQCNCVHGDCRTTDGVTQCVCNSGWTGRLCDKLFGGRYYPKPICTLDGHCVCPPNSDLCQHGESPDLVPSLHRFRPYLEWQTFPECHCAVDAGCTKPGHRKLLRFPMRTDNIGSVMLRLLFLAFCSVFNKLTLICRSNADLLIGAPGDYLDKYVWHICHNHPHFDHFSEFTLRHKTLTSLTAHGFKSGSTVVDSYRWDRRTPFNAVRQYNEKHQGIQAGWADIYPASLDCQWIDVTELPLGDYVLELTTNPLRLIYESNYDNNKVTFDIRCDPPCMHGQCDFGHSCVCANGWQGVACDGTVGLMVVAARAAPAKLDNIALSQEPVCALQVVLQRNADQTVAEEYVGNAVP
ncbi:teneurin-a isoform X2 [Balamuthia mandrillaris]